MTILIVMTVWLILSVVVGVYVGKCIKHCSYESEALILLPALLFSSQPVSAQFAPKRDLPTVTLTANPTTITVGQYSVLSWTSTNADSCLASGGWSGQQALSGTLMVTPTKTTTYTLTCSAGRRSSTISLAITVIAPAPTVTLTANPTSIAVGQSSTLMWNSTNADSCSASGSWSGPQAISGSLMVSPTVSSVYNLTCVGSGGSATSFANIAVTSSGLTPTVTLTANPTTIPYGQSSTLTWSSTNTTGCTAPDGTQGPTSGSAVVSPISSTKFTLICSGSGGSASASASVIVTPFAANNCGLQLGGPVIFCETFDTPYIQPPVPPP